MDLYDEVVKTQEKHLKIAADELRQLGVSKKTIQKIFKEIHKYQQKQIKNAMRNLFARMQEIARKGIEEQ